MTTPVIGIEERRARLGLRHHLAVPAASVAEAAGDLAGLHSSDPASVFLAARARVGGFQAEQLEAALYRDRSLVRMLGMRRTMFVVPRDLAAVMDAACTRPLVAAERKRLVRLLEEQELAADGARWLARVEKRTLAALAERGEATAAELTADVEELGLKLSFGAGKTWAGTVGLSTRVLFLLATGGKIVRGRPRGSWVSSQYRWARTEDWLGGPLPDVDPTAAQAELLRRWLDAYGPGTETDIRWWTGWPVRTVRRALARVGAVEVEAGGAAGFVLDGDVEPAPTPPPWVALLPSLDPTVMGWKERSWYLGGHAEELFDRNGNAGPTVWVDGRIVGGWAQRSDGEVTFALLEDVGSQSEAAVGAVAAELSIWLGDIRVVPRFPTPLDKRLRS